MPASCASAEPSGVASRRAASRLPAVGRGAAPEERLVERLRFAPSCERHRRAGRPDSANASDGVRSPRRAAISSAARTRRSPRACARAPCSPHETRTGGSRANRESALRSWSGARSRPRRPGRARGTARRTGGARGAARLHTPGGSRARAGGRARSGRSRRRTALRACAPACSGDADAAVESHRARRFRRARCDARANSSPSTAAMRSASGCGFRCQRARPLCWSENAASQRESATRLNASSQCAYSVASDFRNLRRAGVLK